MPDHKNYRRGRAVAARRMGRRRARTSGPIDFGGDQSKYFREKIEAPWFAYWLKDKGSLQSARSDGVRNRPQYLGALRRLAAARRNPDAQAVHGGVRHAIVRCPARLRRRRVRQLRFRSRASGAVSPSADSADLFAELGLDAVAGGGSALRRSAAGCAELVDRAAERAIW